MVISVIVLVSCKEVLSHDLTKMHPNVPPEPKDVSDKLATSSGFTW